MSKRVRAFKYILLILVIALIVGLMVYLVPVMKNLSTPEGQLEFKNQVEEMGFLGFLALFGLQFAQIFLIILPGEPMEILAGMCYGGIGGTIFITISACVISSLIFFAVRKFGRKFVYSFCSKERIDKIENSKLFQNPKKIEWIMLLLFVIPGTPKDLLVYIAGLLPLKPLRFILISTFARLPSVVSSTFAGGSIVAGNWTHSIAIYAVTFLLVGIFIFVVNKFDKDKTAEEAMKIMK
jgi:uncharacterized membrane protein YdjX (TVP38/TMEM64 family)